MTRVRIGIVSWNCAGALTRCLGAVAASAAGTDFDVVVVDNASTDDTAARARLHTDVTVQVVNDANVGYARAMNQALLHDNGRAAADVFVALNPDTEPSAGSLTALVDALVADPAIGLAVPRLINDDDDSLQHSVYRFPSPLITAIICLVPVRLQRGPLARRFWLEGRVPHNRACDVDWAIGAVHAIRAGALGGELPYCMSRWSHVCRGPGLGLVRLAEAPAGRRRLFPTPSSGTPGNSVGRRSLGDRRTERWWAATYDWYPLAPRHQGGPSLGHGQHPGRDQTAGAGPAMRRRLFGSAAERKPRGRSHIRDLPRTLLPLHQAMRHAPDAAFQPDLEPPRTPS